LIWRHGARRGRLIRLAALACAMFMSVQPALNAGGKVAGTWLGRYTCGQGTTGLTLYVDELPESRITALFHFYADASNPDVPEGCFEMHGTFDRGTRHIDLRAGRWLLQPYGYITVDLSGIMSGGTISGSVIGPACTTFELHPAGIRVPPDPAACRPKGSVVSSLVQP
jgi:hypothetical protein